MRTGRRRLPPLLYWILRASSSRVCRVLLSWPLEEEACEGGAPAQHLLLPQRAPPGKKVCTLKRTVLCRALSDRGKQRPFPSRLSPSWWLDTFTQIVSVIQRSLVHRERFYFLQFYCWSLFRYARGRHPLAEGFCTNWGPKKIPGGQSGTVLPFKLDRLLLLLN